MRYMLSGLFGILTLAIVYSCQKEVSVEYGTAAKGSLQSTGGDCLPKFVSGTYVVDKSLNDTNYIEVTVDVTSAGPYTIFTDTLNGYSFKASGTFSATGTTTVKLKGSGKPAVAGTDDFTVVFDSSFCEVPVTVTGGSLPTGCNASVQGTYTAGKVLANTNTVTFTHTYTTAGPYTVKTNTVNGYSFGPSSVTAAAGANNITITATGTPTAAGTNSFTIDFGDGQTCSFTVTVGNGTTPPTNTDYFPTTQGSYWTYDDGFGADSFKVAVNGTATFSSQAYAKFVYSDAGGTFFNEYNRKDATSGFYYRSVDTADYPFAAAGVFFNQPRLDVLFLKNTLTTGASWNADFAATIIGMAGTVRFAYNCVDANATVTVNGKNFTNVYKIKEQIQANIGSGFQPAADPLYYYYAKGIGLVLIEDNSNAPLQAIRFWQVN